MKMPGRPASASLTWRTMESKPIDLGLLRSFSPLDGMKRDNLHSLARKASLRELSGGRPLFKEGDTYKRTYYRVRDTAGLRHDGRPELTLRGGTPAGRTPVGRSAPRRYSGRIVSDKAQLISIDRELLDMM